MKLCSLHSRKSMNYHTSLGNKVQLHTMNNIYTFLVCISWFLFVSFAAATTNYTRISNITTTQFLRDPEALASSNGNFMVGFFSPTNSTNRYVGIWYSNKQDSESGISEVVWIANRDNPLINSSDGVFGISENGNLQVLDGQNKSIWSTNISQGHQANNSVAQLLDTGNLVLISNVSGETIWQSFDHLTNSLLPPVTVTLDMHTNGSSLLRSWKSASDPSSGRFSFVSLPRNLPEFFIMDGDNPCWRSGPWNGNLFLGIPYMHSEVSNGFEINNKIQGKLEVSYSVANLSLLERLVLNHDGRLFQEDWNDSSGKWEVFWNSSESECDVYGKCGVFGSCDPKNSPICSCLKGFEPNNKDEWNKGNWTSGCFRRTPLQCGTLEGKSHKFLRLEHMKVPDYAYWVSSGGQDGCERKCLQNCSCFAFAYYTGIGCMMWNTSLVDIQQYSAEGAALFIRLAHSELGEPKQKLIITTVLAILSAIIFIGFMYYGWKLLRQRYGPKITTRDFSLHNTLDDRMDQVQFQDLPLFKFDKLVVATNSFSLMNKIGRGGFGIVYKGKLEDGKEIAVKRLSRGSGQGLREFMNEVVVISKLQHKNLVTLLGCCVEKEEKLLVYEYMPNKSLDAILFDPHLRKDLDWMKRFIIVEGICRGLLYLHRDSRLKIIHRDLKASNILLDEELNPKISDFGMARIFGSKQDQANTLRVVGTYGYMSPEYAMEGRFSEKSDVFGLGVLLLEIVSGRKNNSFSNYESLSLLSYAWKLWNENDILRLIDPAVDFDQSFRVQILKCIQLGLLCVQEYPEDRPTISALISMLDVDDVADLPRPKKPGFTQKKIYSTDDEVVPQYGEEHVSINLVSDLTILSGR